MSPTSKPTTHHAGYSVLSGDIGGTKTRIALMQATPTSVHTIAEETYPSADHPSLESILRQFLGSHPARCDIAGFGVAGPVRDGHATTTNLPWAIDSAQLAEQLALPRVVLLNDLEATAWGIPVLGSDDFAELNPGASDGHGNAAVIAAGTGLGEAGLAWDGDRHRPWGSEGGHASFSPCSPLESALLDHLRQRYDHVSWERVLSGPGLVNVFDFLRAHRGIQPPDWLLQQMTDGDAAAAISKAGLAQRDPLCVEALGVFVQLYASEAANLALKVMAHGGVYLGGGIAPKILDALRAPGFMQAFTGKGRMADLLRKMPVRVILNDRTALYGPAVYAASLLEDQF